MNLLPFLFLLLSPRYSLTDFTCLSGLGPSPGVSMPRGDTEIQVGSKPISLTCHLNPNHSEFLSGVRASNLGFLSNSTILESTIVNETTIRSIFNPVVEGVTDISCVILDDSMATPRHKGVCTQKILVGSPPQKVQDFACVSENWLSLNCTWTEPKNPIPTHYDLHFISQAHFKRCPSITDLEWQLKRSFPRTLKMCYVNFETIPQYRHVAKKFTFYFNATNSLNPSGVVTSHTVKHFSVVRPGPATNLVLTSSSPESLQVQWEISREMVHFPPGLKQMVRYKSQWTNEDWTNVNTDHLNTTHDIFQLDLPSPLVPYTLYTVEVSMISDIPSTPPFLHSNPVQASGLTKPALPSRPPRTDGSCFEIIGFGPDRTVLVYWQAIEAWEQHGPDFTYLITNVVEDSHPLPLLPVKLTQNYAEIGSLPGNKTYSFSIASRNSVGMSSSVASIELPPATVATSLLPRSVTKVFVESDHFIVSWLSPQNSEDVISYTIFWCLSSSGLDRPYQCNGQMDWKSISTKQLNGSLSHSLLLPATDQDSPVFQLAVSANTDKYSSGLQWTTCTIKNDRGVATQVTDVVVESVTARSVVVRWRLDCSQITGLVNSFEVAYCELDHGDTKCQFKHVAAGTNSLGISQLTPFSNYSFTVSVMEAGLTEDAQLSRGLHSLPVVVWTLPSAPGSSPSTLVVSAVTSTTATMAWVPPKKTNGNICKYLVKLLPFSSSGDSFEVIEVLGTKTVLGNLTSYTRYRSEVSACTQSVTGQCALCSQFWAELEFTTLVGPPGSPNTPTVKLLNTTVVEVEWNTDFQLGAAAVQRWELRVTKGGNEVDAYHTVKDGDVTKTIVDIEQISALQSWTSECSNTSVFVEVFYFSVRAEVSNNEGDTFVGAWSPEQSRTINCRPPLPWLLIVVLTTTVPLSLLCVCALTYGFCSWYREKLAMIKKIQGGLDSRDIGPVSHVSAQFVRGEYQLGQMPLNTEEFMDSDVDECQNTGLLRNHKNSGSSSSEDSGVSTSSHAPTSPVHIDLTRQSNSIPSVGSGYVSMGDPSVPRSPVSMQQVKQSQCVTPQPGPGPGYSRIGHMAQAAVPSSYVPFTAIKQVPVQNTPGYISLGQVSELVLQPDQGSAAYSRLGVLEGESNSQSMQTDQEAGPCAKHGAAKLGISVPGVSRLEEDQHKITATSDGFNIGYRKSKPTQLNEDYLHEASLSEQRSSPYSSNFTCV